MGMGLAQLPQELLLRVIEEIDNMSSLTALTLTCHAVHNTILQHERLVCERVLLNHIRGPDWKDLVFACTILREEPREGWTPTEQQRLVQDHQNLSDEQAVADMTLDKAVSIATLFDAIDYFSSGCAAKALAIAHERYCPDASEEPVPTEPEILRNRRAFLHFELYCSLFSRLDNWPRADQDNDAVDNHIRSIFWDKYSPWEMEQVACVYDYFYRRLGDIFEDLALQDPEWAVELSIAGGVNGPMIEWWLAIGLKNLRTLISGDWATRRKMLDDRARRYRVMPCFLTDGLRIAIDHREDDTQLQSMTPEIEAEFIRPAFHQDDQDPGPETVWRWAHHSKSPDNIGDRGWVLSDLQMSLREFGCVFWDQARISRWRLLERPWQGEHDTAMQREDKEMESRDRIQALAESLAEQGKTSTYRVW
ncbi:hypothetical protein HII31_01714 [Pseudocercospora fuligena]|uniref:F-box domain-containing protein n=1 Tax=Pseudocercospora fuligena TaxID=685502 RepID=A0A8H6RTD7_9PEZI|nr:hypothetical protein HII31_01714 [Pseudocercospora fuligena]